MVISWSCDWLHKTRDTRKRPEEASSTRLLAVGLPLRHSIQLRFRDTLYVTQRPHTTRHTQVVYLYAADNSIGPRIRYNPPVHHQVRGFCHDSTPVFLPVGVPGTPVAVCHAARCLAQPMRDGPGHASHA